jgi:hypothetical protein
VLRNLANLFIVAAGTLLAQTATPPPEPGQLPPVTEPPSQSSQLPPVPKQDKRIFGVLPNYRTAEMAAAAQALNPKQKFRIALKDSFDYPLVLLAGAYAALYQWDDNHPQFGQGAKGYFSRLGTSYSDQVVGNMMTEGLFPVLLHEDPRYFRMAEGTKTRRTLYALSRIFVTRTDAGGTSFNYAEVIGNGVAAGIGLSYYSDNRNVPDFMQNWGIQLATDATSQVLKEYWPDVKRWWRRRHPRK